MGKIVILNLMRQRHGIQFYKNNYFVCRTSDAAKLPIASL